MKYIFLLLLLNSCLFAGNEIIIKTTSEKITFELHGNDSLYNKGDIVNFQLEIHNNSDRKYFIFDPKANDFSPLYDSTSLSNRVFFSYGGTYQFDINSNQQLRVLNPGESLSIPLKVDSRILKLSVPYTNLFFVSINIGYLPYKEELEYLTKSDNGLVYFRNNDNMMWAIDSLRTVQIGYLGILIRGK